MKYIKLSIILLGILIMTNCSKNNAFFKEWDTPFQTPPFDQIGEADYMPALKEGLKQEAKEIKNIIKNKETPSFKNTIEAYEASGQFLGKVTNVFYSVLGTDATDGLDNIAEEIDPIMTQHNDDITLNDKLFKRIKVVYDSADRSVLTTEQNTLLEKIYDDFARNGANLNNKQKDELRKINEDLSRLALNFDTNVRNDGNQWKLVLEESDLDGLPESVKLAAADIAIERGYEGKWVITLDKPSWIPFLTYSTRRDLREKVFTAYINRGNNENKYDTKSLIPKIVNLRIKRANLLGYNTHADYVLERSMAKTTDNVYNFLYKLWKPALNRAKAEAYDLQSMIYDDGDNFKLEPWDWWYYSERIRKDKYDLDDNELRPYFKLDNVLNGAFWLANQLFGITFEERTDIPKYYDEVKTYEVKEADGSHIGILYTDYHPRKGKGVGAWCGGFRDQSNRNGDWVYPLVTNVGNFTSPVDDKPALLSLGEVGTLFHEFGHGLHGLLGNLTYTDITMSRDFVEFPSTIMENWAVEPEMLKKYALHFETGEPIPDELIDKIQKASLHNQGFINVEYLAASILDMDWHTLQDTSDWDPIEFDNQSMNRIGLIPEINQRYNSYYFKHIFAGWAYSAGYYSYIWAEILDADAFQYFKDSGDLFNKVIAAKYRKFALGLSGTEDPAEIYRKFRGKDPEIEALLIRRGLK
ncbi:MAG: M3 family metallopeptidase [Candidatus Marinimicrobia bacterium]|nr:M3 family metallopeptidase [Candidatus Neomarinimicrobiota bacterium]